ncbi:hypothetical protein [Parapedobacter flavus]|uniref:hypothetical protein n=1 Tax=Parapedobacter flavus TaxID=3110225 RepID=UPI003F50FAF9
MNAYNFMDGINGITAMYSFAVLLLLWLGSLFFSSVVLLSLCWRCALLCLK